jgi:GNAT superfamily N-acetyltransferase
MSPQVEDERAAKRWPPGARTVNEGSRLRCRSFCFLERQSERWTAFLMTYRRDDGQWRGYFTFRSAAMAPGTAELRTADLFLERSEDAVDQRARGLGRPLLSALLDSAITAQERRSGVSPHLHRWFRQQLMRGGTQREAGWQAHGSPTLEELRSLYDSYRLDQVAHLVALLEPDDFREVVEVLLSGRRVDFRESDRFQHAMSVVQELERRLPLPPFEVWVEDYLAHPDAYRRYAYELHRGEELP